MKHHIKTKYCDGLVSFRWGAYAGGQRSLRLVSEDGEPMMTATVCMPDYQLPFGHVIVKDYSENEGIREELIRVGVIKPRPVDVIQSGYVNLYVHELLPGVDESGYNPKSEIPTSSETKSAFAAPRPGVDKVVKILVRRDELSYDEAREIVEDVRATMLAILNDDDLSPFDTLEQMTELFEGELGLEPDYIEDLLFEQL